MSKVSITPTIFLKGIDPQAVYKAYQERAHLEYKLEKEKITTEVVIPALAAKGSHDSGISVRLNNNCTYTIMAKSGCAKYNYFKEHGERLKGGDCQICKKHFEHEVIGTIDHYAKQLIELDNGEKRVVEIFWDGEGEFCSFQCCLRYTMMISSPPYPCRDPLTFDSETALRHLYSLVTGKRPQDLRPANNPALLLCNGGSLERRDWEEDCYEPTGGLVLFPALREYLNVSVSGVPASQQRNSTVRGC